MRRLRLYTVCPACGVKVLLLARNKIIGREAWQCESCKVVIEETEMRSLRYTKVEM